MSGEGGHPCTVIAVQRVRPEQTAAFLERQEEISAAMAKLPEFLGKELISPQPGLQDEWVAVFRFASIPALRRWMDSAARREMVQALEQCTDGPAQLQVVAGSDKEAPPVTVVFSHKVRPGRESDFRMWREDVLREMARSPGFLGADVFDPREGVQDEWVHIVRFGSAENLEEWMASPTRAECVGRLHDLIESYTVRPLASGLGGWFAFDDAPDAPRVEPPRWKQMMLVTLGLYPTVMLLIIFVEPLLWWMPVPVRIVASNVMCVSLLTWVVMPRLTGRFSRWLDARERHSGGALFVASLLAALVLIFLALWGRAFSV